MILGGILALECAFVLFVVWMNRPQTRFASGFSREAFRQIQTGQTEAEIVRRVGQPLARFDIEGSKVIMRYTEPVDRTRPYEVFLIVLDATGVVRGTDTYIED